MRGRGTVQSYRAAKAGVDSLSQTREQLDYDSPVELGRDYQDPNTLTMFRLGAATIDPGWRKRIDDSWVCGRRAGARTGQALTNL